jgi:glyoxylase-like metal-dependent hydrolase (beta-lactamase superfamily II)
VSRRAAWLFFVAAAAVLPVLAAAVCLAQQIVEVAPGGGATSVPPWDARGLGPLPWQGIACIDMTADAARIALGTIAPAGDPNAFLLGGDGKLVGACQAGERWIGAVAVGGGGSFFYAISTTPKGTSGDVPEASTFSGENPPAEAADRLSAGRAAGLFHYGEHSNHAGALLQSAGQHTLLVLGDQVVWLPARAGAKQSPFHWGRDAGAEVDGLATAAAISSSGRAVVGCTGRPTVKAKEKFSANLFLLESSERSPVWSRPVSTDTDVPPASEKGAYGPPAPAYQDLKLWAPLAVAVDGEGQRVAAADYQGWQRQFAASGLRRSQSYGVRFTPSRPTIHVYDAQGKTLRRFGPETFREAFWCDLAFCGDGSKLLAFPHSWTCRGLAGQTILPADAGARSLYVLDVATGQTTIVRFPDAISSLSPSGVGTTTVGCWNGRVYLLDRDYRPVASAAEGWPVGAPSLVRASRDGTRILVATTNGTVQMLDGAGKRLWQADLNQMATPGKKPWLAKQQAAQVGPGVWRSNSGRAHSDLGGQYVVQAPQGLILIDPNAGLSLEQNWARLEGAGLDPRQVRYVLLTHEHGDHAPGAYLWRVITGAKVVASAETAYILQHHIPIGTGYGLHPPNPVDIVVTEDSPLELAGLKVQAIRLPGHTYGSMGWAFQKDGTTYVAIGDVIMPGGTLGYSGSINFSAADVLQSLRKLARLRPDSILPGHGPTGDPAPYATKGIEVGESTGWGKMKPEKPDPLYGLSRRNYLVAGWREPIESAAFGDIDGDGRPDVAILTPAPAGSAVKIYLNRGGRFAEDPDCVVDVPEIENGSKLRLAHLNNDRVADFLLSGDRAAVLLLSQGGKLAFRAEPLPGVVRASQLLAGDFNQDGRTDCLVGQRFTNCYHIAYQSQDGQFRTLRRYSTQENYFDLQLADLDGDGREDLIVSDGEVFLRRPDGSFHQTPNVKLSTPGEGWTYMAAADFNGDRKNDVVLLSDGNRSAKVAVFYNTGSPREPFTKDPNAAFDLPLQRGLLRDGTTVGDFNGDGTADLVISAAQDTKATILLGSSPGGLSPQRKVVVELDYAIHHDTKLGLADFSGRGRMELAGFGASAVKVPGVYIRLDPAAAEPSK